MSVIDEVAENATQEAAMEQGINESVAPKDPEGDLSEYTFEGEGEEDGEIAELVKRSNT